MFPIDFLRLSSNEEVTIFMKNGETLKGILMTMDNYMNLRLKKADLTSKDGKLRKMEEAYIRGIEIKNIQLPDSVLDAAAEIERSRHQPRVVPVRRENFGRSHDQNRQRQPRNVKDTRVSVKDPVPDDEWVC